MKLHERFPYQFAGRKLMVSRGWLPVLERACEEIDEILGRDKREFHWVEIKQKYGGLHLYYEMEGPHDDVLRKVDRTIFEAELQSEKTCEICAAPGEVQQQDFWQDCLCAHHREIRKTMKTGDWRALVSHERLYES